ncbi:hypothetical protein LLG10_01855 [bacterium]|nr:hypothetical protein [bacterium]
METVSWERWVETIEYALMAPVRRITLLLSVLLIPLGSILFQWMETWVKKKGALKRSG